jgi:uncharacterized protein (DUF608 family)
VKGAEDTWRVTETEDHLVGGVFINCEARVQRVGQDLRGGRETSRNQIVINAPVHALQVDSMLSSQTVITHETSAVITAVTELSRAVEKSQLPELDREEVILALQRVAELSKREKTPDVIKKANEKLELIRNTLEISKDLALVAAPYLPILYQAFGG